MRKYNKVLAAVLTLVMVLSSILMPFSSKRVALAAEKTASEQYVEAMGSGVNLGNSFDSFDRIKNIEIDDETAWGNPIVTREYINSLKADGFNSIRIPFTAFTRTGTDYKINETYLKRYENVVNYALDAGLYVMVNLHHDSSEWLKYWDGNTSSEQYVKFVALWTQLADRFKNYGDHLMFESINEVCFDKSVCPNDDKQNEYVGKINQAFYNVVRSSGGKNATRMLVLPTTYTNHGLLYSQYLVNFIKNLNDKNVIATVHYYSTSVYAFTCNIGLPEFDEQHWGTTARGAVDEFYNALQQTFVANGIGVIVGEYGLFNMGMPNSLENGEMVKFFDYMNARGKELGICNMLWDNGGIINRNTGEFKNNIWGDAIKSSMAQRSSYATGLDQLFVTNSTAKNDRAIPLTLNGNTLSGIYNGSTKLVEGTDYTYANGTVTLLGSYISKLITGDYGVKADLRFVFSAGSDWHEYINYEGTAVFTPVNAAIRSDNGYMATYDTDGTANYPVAIIPVDFNGKLVRRIASLDSSGQPKSASTWANSYMQCGYEYVADYNTNELGIMYGYNKAITDGTYTLVIDFYDGTTAKYSFTRTNGMITGYQITDTNVSYNFSITKDWADGCDCSLTVTNTTGKDFTNGWTLNFDFDRAISSVYGAKLVSSSNGHYVISNEDYNAAFANGKTFKITFLAGSGNSSSIVSNCVLQ
jgi:Endoglucanase